MSEPDPDFLLFDERESYKILWLEYKLSGEKEDVLKALCVMFHITLKRARMIIRRIDAKTQRSTND